MLSYSRESLKLVRKKLSWGMRSRWPKHVLGWTVNLYLSHVRIPPILMIAYYRDLDHERSDWSFVHVFDRNNDPPTRFVQIHYFDFLEIVEVRSSSDTYSKNTIDLHVILIDKS